MTIVYTPWRYLIPHLKEQLEVPNQEQSDIVESGSENYTEGTNDTR